MDSMHVKFLELDVDESVIASDNIDFVMPDVVTLSLPNFDNIGSSTTRGGFAPNKNVVEPIVENVVDRPIVAEVIQLVEPIEQIHVRRSVRQKWPAILDDFVVYLSEDAYDVHIVINYKII